MANQVAGQGHRRAFQDISVSYGLLAATDPDRTPLIACQNSKHTLYIQKIKVFVNTVAAQSITFISSTTSVIIGVLPASAALGEYTVLDSEEGRALPAGESLNVVGTAGVAGNVVVEGYQRLTPNTVLLPSEI